MRLTSFCIENFRGITNKVKIDMSRYSVFIGQNNAGKTNILNGLDIAMKALSYIAQAKPQFRKNYREHIYSYKRDYPKVKQNSAEEAKTQFTLGFLLEANDRSYFAEKIGTIGTHLNLDITITGSGYLELSILGDNISIFVEQGEKEIAEFIYTRIEFIYIPAIRTIDSIYNMLEIFTNDIMDEMKRDDSYSKAMGAIAEEYEKRLQKLSTSIKESLSEFYRDIGTTTIIDSIHGYPQRSFLRRRRSIDLLIDDGTETSFENKGDGIISIIAIGLLKHTYNKSTSHKKLILAIEEPESHLHPDAIHKLKGAIYELSQNNQVIISTHNPTLISRDRVEDNIIVKSEKAKPAGTIVELRDILGVKVSDNLTNVDVILLVEGHHDVGAITAILRSESTTIRNALDSKVLDIKPLGGVTNLQFYFPLYTNLLCQVHCYLDYDGEAKGMIHRLKKNEVLMPRDLTTTIYPYEGEDIECEFEDIVDTVIYQELLLCEYNISVNGKYSSASKKWSKWIEAEFIAQGQPFNDGMKKKIKEQIAKVIEDNPTNAINQNRRGSINSLIRALETKIKNRTKS